MNFRGFAFLIALFTAVQLTTFTWAAQNLTKTSGKDYDEQGKHLGEQPVRRMIEEECTLGEFSLGGGKPVFPERQGLTFPICQDNHYATFYDNEWGIARYAVYKITPQQTKADRVQRVCDPWRPTEKIGIRQGSKELYENQPKEQLKKVEYEKGHIVPFDILAYSYDSAFATFYYTNCVPQNQNFNKGQWARYEKKIVNYAQYFCSPSGGTLYLITGTSRVKFDPNLQGEVQPMRPFHDKEPNIGLRIAIPNSMWTVGCCWSDKVGVVGAFGVMGDNSRNPDLNKSIMSTQSVQVVENVLHLENPEIKLFPGSEDCYKTEKNVKLNDLKFKQVS